MPLARSAVETSDTIVLAQVAAYKHRGADYRTCLASETLLDEPLNSAAIGKAPAVFFEKWQGKGKLVGL